VGWDPAAALFTLRGIRRQVVAPLNNLVAASERIEQGDFSTPARIPPAE
jgi:two-component system nitrate/nitrite sensor histidine kinase NarQ